MSDEKNTTKLIFEEPPPAAPRGGISPVRPWLDALRGHPGEWVKYPEPFMSSGAASNITRARAYGLRRAGEFEAVMRPTTNRRFFLYARYVGEGSKS